MKMTAALWLMRLAALSAVAKVSGRITEKKMTSTRKPSTAGRLPTSPPRTFAT